MVEKVTANEFAELSWFMVKRYGSLLGKNN